MRSLLLAGLVCSMGSPALSLISAITLGSTAVSLAVPTLTLTSTASLGTSLAALGLLKLKGAALLALSRQRRSAEAVDDLEDNLFLSVLKLEEAKCVRRFLCEVATGQLTAPEYLGTVEPLLAQPLDQQVDSVKFIYSEAVKSGARHQNIEKCQAKFSCPKTGAEIYTAMAAYGA